MAKAKKDTKDFRNLEIKEWNATTFREYMKHLNIERFGIPCVSNNIRVENAMLSQMIKEFGKEVTKEFIEECVKRYRPSAGYPTVNFITMYRFMRAYELPRVLDRRRKQAMAEVAVKLYKETEIDVEDFF